MRAHEILTVLRTSVLLGSSLTFQACGPADSGAVGSPPIVRHSWPAGIPTGPTVSISSLSPESATAGSSDLRLSITGGGFSEPQGHHRTWVLWDFVGLPTSVLATTVKSKAELTVLVPATLLAAPGVARLTVESGDPMGDEFARSRSLDFHIVP